MRPFPFLLALALLASSALAADLYLTPAGAGRKDGSSWENAFSGAALDEAVNARMKPGDRLQIGGGAYPNVSLKINTGGELGKPKTIIGVDRAGSGLPVFSSSWVVEKPDKGAAFLTLEPGVSFVTVQHLRVNHFCLGVKAGPSPEKPRTNLIFDDLDIEQHRHGFYLSDCNQMLIQNCDLKRYTKHGFRLEQGCNAVTYKNCTADCSEGDLDWETKTELFPFGFTVNNGGAPSTKLTFEDCVSRNNMKSNQGTLKYTNGDGFVLEGNTRDVTFLRCRSLRNQDGGFDLKVPDVKLTNCVATSNRRDFRIWQTATLTNCFGGWSTTGLWCEGGPVTADHCTFHEHKNAGVESDKKATATITVTNSLISGSAGRPTAGSLVELKDSVVTLPGTPNAKDPGFPKADPKWDGTGNAMDAAAYPEKGYRSTRK